MIYQSAVLLFLSNGPDQSRCMVDKRVLVENSHTLHDRSTNLEFLHAPKACAASTKASENRHTSIRLKTVAAHGGMPKISTYSISKAALNSMTKIHAYELRAARIRCTTKYGRFQEILLQGIETTPSRRGKWLKIDTAPSRGA